MNIEPPVNQITTTLISTEKQLENIFERHLQNIQRVNNNINFDMFYQFRKCFNLYFFMFISKYFLVFNFHTISKQ